MIFNVFLSVSYGYQNNQYDTPHQQFYFSKPRYEIFPYSQEDHSQQQHHQHSYSHYDSGVEITQSQGYEIKEIPEEHPQTYGQNFVRFPGQSANNNQLRSAAAQEEVPVIVLKVPGPSKYAAHLRTLLQQYLEIRAAEVIRELEQQEYAAEQYRQLQVQQHYRQPENHQIHHSTGHNQGLQTHVQYGTPATTTAEEENHSYHNYNRHQEQYEQPIHSHGQIGSDERHHYYSQQGHSVYGVPSTQAPESNPLEYLQGEYEPNAQAGHTIYEDHQTQYITEQEHYQQQQPQQPQHQPQDYHHHGHIQYAEQEEEHQYYQTPAPEQEPRHHQPEQHVQQEEASAEGHGAQGHPAEGAESHIENLENYPDDKHTRVVFTKTLHQKPFLQIPQPQQQQQHQYPAQMPIIVTTPEPQHPHSERFYLPTPSPTADDYAQVDFHQQQEGIIEQQHEHQHEQQHELQHHQLDDYQQQQVAATPGPFITITQKRKMNRVPFNYHAHGRVSTPPPRKRETPYTEDQFNKFSKLVNRLKKKQTKLMINERSKKSAPEQHSKAQ